MGGTILQRLEAKTDRSGECWLWKAGKQWQGYGKFWAHGRTIPAEVKLSKEFLHTLDAQVELSLEAEGEDLAD